MQRLWPLAKHPRSIKWPELQNHRGLLTQIRAIPRNQPALHQEKKSLQSLKSVSFQVYFCILKYQVYFYILLCFHDFQFQYTKKLKSNFLQILLQLFYFRLNCSKIDATKNAIICLQQHWDSTFRIVWCWPLLLEHLLNQLHWIDIALFLANRGLPLQIDRPLACLQ